MVRRCLRVIAAFSVSVLINGGLAVGMAVWTDLNRPQKAPVALRKPVEIPLKKSPPKKKHAETTKQRSRDAQIAKAALPRLNLPSSISVPVFTPETASPAEVVHPMDTVRSFRLGEETILTEEMVDEPPKPLMRAPVRYPRSAEVQGIEGEVDARVLLDANGSVLQVEIVSAKPEGIFESAASASLVNWRFSPATFRGQTIKAWVRQRVVFKLN